MTVNLPDGPRFGAGDTIQWEEVLGGRVLKIRATVLTYRNTGRHQIMQCEADAGQGICTVVATYIRETDGGVEVSLAPVNQRHADAFVDAVLCGREPRAPVNVINRTLAAALVAAQRKDVK